MDLNEGVLSHNYSEVAMNAALITEAKFIRMAGSFLIPGTVQRRPHPPFACPDFIVTLESDGPDASSCSLGVLRNGVDTHLRGQPPREAAYTRDDPVWQRPAWRWAEYRTGGLLVRCQVELTRQEVLALGS